MAKTAPDEIDALIAAIWGRNAPAASAERDPELRAAQNLALGIAIKAYLQSYLDDADPDNADPDDAGRSPPQAG